ncbi:hypothetical protein G5I_09631 [Acromyrmex echinatior]|uniref:Uncharacterized protein n=1 Tax=Acromyrmex echinatior TaxID=103372 RepID=F4WUQ4_ACREC|nr:hypothetical protein G5I_09631 [Acromyrmex echinatior]
MVGWIQLLGEQYCFAVIVCSSTCSDFPGLGPLASYPMSRYTMIFCLLAITPTMTRTEMRTRMRIRTKTRTRMMTSMSHQVRVDEVEKAESQNGCGRGPLVGGRKVPGRRGNGRKREFNQRKCKCAEIKRLNANVKEWRHRSDNYVDIQNL